MHATVVVKMVTGLRFSYFLGGGGAQEGWGGDGDVGRGWVTEWRDPERLPLAVSVAIVAEGGEVATTVVLRQR